MNREFGEEEEVGLSYYGRGQILLIRLLRVGGIESTSNDFGGGAVLRAARGEDPHPRPLSRKAGRGEKETGRPGVLRRSAAVVRSAAGRRHTGLAN